jgi:hypothetical protein
MEKKLVQRFINTYAILSFRAKREILINMQC